MKLILDIGSCHMGKLEYAKEAIDLAAEVNATIKFQLFEGNLNGNIPLPRKWWPELVEYAKGKTAIFASAFDEEAIQLLHDTGIKLVKLSYSQAFNLKLIRKARKLGMQIWASGDMDNYPSYADQKLFCISEYPPKKKWWKYITDETENLFDGFSSHFLEWKEDIEILKRFKGWGMLEKHFTLFDKEDIICPDNYFAIGRGELKALVKNAKNRSDSSSAAIIN